MRRLKLQRLLFWALLLAMTCVYMGPFLFSLSISLSAEQDVFDWPIRLIPEVMTLGNYAAVWDSLPFARWLTNSVVITTAQTVCNVFFASLAGFAFARMNFPGRDLLFGVFLSSLMIPGIVLLVPKFSLLNELRLINTYAGLILPGLVSVVNIFLMRQFFLTIPKDLEEAALIDGCGYFRMYWQVFLPMSGPALAAVAIYTFQGSWNEFMWPVIVTTTSDMFTLPVGMAYLKNEYQVNWPLLMAGTILISLPTLVIFLLFQRYFVSGIATSGLKE